MPGRMAARSHESVCQVAPAVGARVCVLAWTASGTVVKCSKILEQLRISLNYNINRIDGA